MEHLLRRKKDIEEHLAKDLALLKEWEDELRLADDPKEKAKCREEIGELNDYIAERKQELHTIQANLQQWNEALKVEAQKQKQLAELYSQGMAYFERREWEQAIHWFEQILGIDGGYKDASRKLAQAKRKQRTLLWKASLYSTGQRVQGFWARHKTRIPVLAVLLLMVAGITFLGKRIVSILEPTPTPFAAQASVEAFLITKGEGPTVTIKPGTTTTATVEEIVGIKVEVSTASQEQEEALSFTWYSCRTGASPVLQRVGNPEMLYIAPSEPGSDCICVVIEKGGALLDRSEIFVDVQK